MVEVREKYITIAKAAQLLEVSKSTLWRWINKGDIPAYRFGHRRVLIKQDDLDKLITPARVDKGDAMFQKERDRLLQPLTKQEQEKALAILESAKRLRQEMVDKREGELFSDSAELIQQMRQERSDQLS